LCCGAQAASYVPHKFKYDPLWLMLMPPIIRFIYGRQYVRVATPLCKRHRNRLKLPVWGAYFLVATVLPVVPVLVLLNAIGWHSLGGFLTVLLVLYLIALLLALAVVRLSTPRMVEFDQSSLVVVNAAQAFAHAHTNFGGAAAWGTAGFGPAPVMAQVANPLQSAYGQASYPQPAYPSAGYSSASYPSVGAYQAAKHPAQPPTQSSADTKVLLFVLGGGGAVVVVVLVLAVTMGMAMSKPRRRARPAAPPPTFVAVPPPQFAPPAMPRHEHRSQTTFSRPTARPARQQPGLPPAVPAAPVPTFAPPVFSPPVFSPADAAEPAPPQRPGEAIARAPEVDPFAETAPPPPKPKPALRTWSDASGNFRVEARLLEVVDGKARLERADGKVIVVPLERLSPADQQIAKSAQP
jgi:hypothetical protein